MVNSNLKDDHIILKYNHYLFILNRLKGIIRKIVSLHRISPKFHMQLLYIFLFVRILLSSIKLDLFSDSLIYFYFYINENFRLTLMLNLFVSLAILGINL